MLGSGRAPALGVKPTDMTADGGLAAWAEASGHRRARVRCEAACGSRSTGGCRRRTGRTRSRRGRGSGSRRRRWSAGTGMSWRSSSTRGEPDGGVGPPPAGRRARRPLADPGRGWDAIVIGEYERAFYGSQYAMMAPLFEHYGVQLWMPEAGGRVDFASEHDEQAMTSLGLSSKREVTRTSIRVRTAMAAQTREQGRYLGGRPPYGYRLGDAGPHPNKAHAAWGRRAHRLEPDPETAHVVRWIFAQRLAGHSAARIARALNEAGIPCPSAADPGRNPHRPGTGWTLARSPRSWPTRATPAARCGTGSGPTRTWPTRPMSAWGTAGAAVEPARRLGHLQQPAHEALVSEADFIAAQDVNAARGPAPRTTRAAGKAPVPAGRAPDVRDLRAADGIGVVQRQARLPVPSRPHQRRPARSRQAEERLRPRGPCPAALGRLAPPADKYGARPARTGAGPRRHRCLPSGQPGGSDRLLRANGITLTYDPATETLRAAATGTRDHHRKSKLNTAERPEPEGGTSKKRRTPGAGGSLRAGDNPACPETGAYGDLTVSEGGLEPPQPSPVTSTSS